MQFDQLKRREFITLLGGAAAAWPLTVRAQQGERLRRIGVLMNLAADDAQSMARIAAFLQGLQQLGWTDGQNVAIEYRWGAGDPERIRKFDLGGLGTAPAASTGSTMVVEKGPKKKPRQKKGGTSIWVRGGRLAFSLHKAIPPSFTLHKAKVACPPRARKWPRCRRGQFLPDTQIYWSAEGAAFSFRYQNQFGAWGIVPPAFITRIRQLCACRGPFPAHIFAAGDPTAWLRW